MQGADRPCIFVVLRHLAQSTPYLPKEIKFLSDPEEDAERFARKHLTDYQADILLNQMTETKIADHTEDMYELS